MPGLFDSYGAYLKRQLADNAASGFVPAQTPTPDLSPAQGLTVAQPKGLFARFKATDPDTGVNGWDRLMLAGAALKAADPEDGGATLRNVMSAQRAQVQAAQARARQQQLGAAADQLKLDPRERLVFMANPEEWAKQNATRYGFHDVTGGNTVVNGPGGAMQVAPKLVDHDGVYGVQDAGGYTQTGQAGPSFSEDTARQKAIADIQNAAARLGIDRDQLAEMIRNHRANEAVAQGNLGVRQKEYEARLKGLGGFGTPGVGNIIGPTLGPDWEIQ